MNKSINVKLVLKTVSGMLASLVMVSCSPQPQSPSSGFDPGKNPGFDPGKEIGPNPPSGKDSTEYKYDKTWIGANFNENVEQIAGVYRELNADKVPYIRSFLNITPLLKRNDSGITGLKTADIAASTFASQFIAAKKAVPSAKMVFTLKTVFENLPGEVPAKGSAGAAYVIDCMKEVLLHDNLGANVDVLVLGNEPMWENGDAEGNDRNYCDFVTALASAVAGWKAEYGWSFKVFTGALNRVSLQYKKDGLIPLLVQTASACDDINGLDLHLHAATVAEFNDCLNIVRNTYGFKKELMCSEVSVVWKFDEILNNPLGSWGPSNGYTSTQNRYAWLYDAAMKSLAGNPVSSDIFRSFFFDGMPAYPSNWFTTLFNACKKYEVSFITPRFSAKESDAKIDSSTTMWELGAIYSARFLGREPDGTMRPSPLVHPQVVICREQ